MEKQSFDKILAIEKDIRTVLKKEQRRAEEWLATIKQELEAAGEREEKCLRKALKAELEAARKEAEHSKQQELKATEQSIEETQKLSREQIKKLIAPQLRIILAEVADDRQNGEN